MKGKRWLWFIPAAVLALAAAGFCLAPRPVMKVGDQSVSAQEAKVYVMLSYRRFEQEGGEEIWKLDFEGQSAEAAAEEAALESLLQVKVLQNQDRSLSEEERAKLEEKLPALRALLGEAWLQEEKISDSLLMKILRENYLAWRYENRLGYEAEEEEQLQEEIDQAFASYEELDRDEYLARVKIDYILCYTGEWTDNQWVEYPFALREEKSGKIGELLRRLRQGEAFETLKAEYHEESARTEGLLFAQGIWAGEEPGEYLYRGQIQDSIAGKIFRMKAGETSGRIDTPYGYLVVQVQEFRPAEAADEEAMENQLAKARENLRQEKLEELRQASFRNEVEQLRAEADIRIWEARWAALLEDCRRQRSRGLSD